MRNSIFSHGSEVGRKIVHHSSFRTAGKPNRRANFMPRKNDTRVTTMLRIHLVIARPVRQISAAPGFDCCDRAVAIRRICCVLVPSARRPKGLRRLERQNMLPSWRSKNRFIFDAPMALPRIARPLSHQWEGQPVSLILPKLPEIA
jgi:hypothetical protein